MDCEAAGDERQRTGARLRNATRNEPKCKNRDVTVERTDANSFPLHSHSKMEGNSDGCETSEVVSGAGHY
jgi:hypothetical protein